MGERLFVYHLCMFEALERAVREADIAVTGAELSKLVAISEQLQALIVESVSQFDADTQWAYDGAVSMAGWLATHTGLSRGRAGGMTAVARRLRGLPVTSAAWRNGELSSGQLEAVMANVAAHHAALWAEHESGVVPALVGLSLVDTVRAMREWANKAEAVKPKEMPKERDRQLSVSQTLDGRRDIKGHVHGDDGVLLDTALRVATSQDPEDGPKRTFGEKKADALIDICKYFLDHQNIRTASSHRPHVNVIVTHEELEQGMGGRYEDGTLIDRVALQAVMCDCSIHRVLVDQNGAVLDFGTATNTIDDNVRAALVVRDQGCRFPGCDRPATWTDAHHVTWWRHGGPTKLENLVCLCRAHHRVVHKPGWSVQLIDGAIFEVTDPTGRVRTTWPPGHIQKRIA